MNKIYVACNQSNYKKGRNDKIRYIVIHYTANNGDTAKNNADYYATAAIESSAHYFVDEYNTVYQSVKDSDTAWAVGGTSVYLHPDCRNSNSISIEMCSRNSNGSGKQATDDGWYFKEQTIANAAALTKELMQKYNIAPENVIRHYDVWGKICPAPFVNNPEKWEDFKSRIKGDDDMARLDELEVRIAAIEEREKEYAYVPDMPQWAQQPMTKLYNMGVLKGDGDKLNLSTPALRILCIVVRILENLKLI